MALENVIVSSNREPLMVLRFEKAVSAFMRKPKSQVNQIYLFLVMYCFSRRFYPEQHTRERHLVLDLFCTGSRCCCQICLVASSLLTLCFWRNCPNLLDCDHSAFCLPPPTYITNERVCVCVCVREIGREGVCVSPNPFL